MLCYSWDCLSICSFGNISTTGLVSCQETQLSSLVTVPTSRWEYSTDGNTWYKIGKGSSSAMVPIAFSSSDLVNGKLTITHNFNNKYVLGLGYTITPKGIDYQNNAVVLDYSDRSADSISGVVWFYGSNPTMLG